MPPQGYTQDPQMDGTTVRFWTIKTIWITLCTSDYCFIFWNCNCKIVSSFIHFILIFFFYLIRLYMNFEISSLFYRCINNWYLTKWRKYVDWSFFSISQIYWNSEEHANDMYITSTYWRITLFTFLQLARLQRECPPWPPTPWPVTWTAHVWL